MRRAKRTLLAFTLLATAGSLPAPVIAKEKPPSVSYDPYTRTTTISGQGHMHNAFFDLDKWSYWLSAAIVDGVPRNPVLMVSTDTPEWYFFDQAADSDGNRLPVIKGNQDIRIGGVHELFGIELTPAYLKQHRTTGFNFKMMGNKGARILIVPPEVIAAFEPVWLAEVEKAGGFREDLAATQRAIAPTPHQNAQAASAGARNAASQGGLGIAFASLPQGILITAVAPGSRAERGHLKPGQFVTAINGTGLAGMSQSEVQTLLKASTGITVFSVAGIGDLTVAP
ncbi:PDZ domain-containing protein [Sphingobium sp. DEHP117]|uniref:PDZ domain-containing protein n=1 Tax=Sphingobium sp. DEHP117 TaxID=2993436 RepID=UPI0027D71C77|nr:PDZ domain-containing protein [Sphingobium sp. DEHP117]MDQ4418945.1 PDZ domain-containing protein [Sphingobium sp. DEHP117]